MSDDLRYDVWSDIAKFVAIPEQDQEAKWGSVAFSCVADSVYSLGGQDPMLEWVKYVLPCKTGLLDRHIDKEKLKQILERDVHVRERIGSEMLRLMIKHVVATAVNDDSIEEMAGVASLPF